MKIKTKRLIAQMVAGVFMAGAIACASISVTQQSKINSTINDIDFNLVESYNNISSSKGFKQEYLANCQKYIDDYSNDTITFEQCSDKLAYFQSQQYIDDYIASRSNEYQEVIDLNSNKQTLDERRKNLLMFSAISTTGCGIVGLASMLYQDALKDKEKDYQY